MSVKRIVTAQYRDIVDRAAGAVKGVTVPKEGWIRTVRKALDMSAIQLAKRLKVTRVLIYKTEKAELTGGVTLKKMQQIAEGLGCKFIYAIVPHSNHSSVQDMINFRAKKKALAIIKKTSTHMALEDQSLSLEQMDAEIERLVDEIVRDMPSDFWDE